jgi:sucrose-6-phosphate hydrolase SacC (GH32 family)
MEINTDSINMMQCEMVIDFSMIENAADSILIILENNLKEQLVIGYTGKQKQIFVNRTKAGRSDFSGKFAGISSSAYEAGDTLKFRILMDASSSELFVDNGKLVMTNLVFPTESYTKLKVFSTNEVTLENSVFYSLKSIWQQ